MKKETKTPNAATGKTAMCEKLIDAVNDIFMSEKPFGCIKVIVNGNPHLFGIMMWGEYIKDMRASALYYSEDKNFNFQKMWEFCATEVYDIWFKRKVAEGMIKGHLDINFLPVKTETDAKDYVFNIANEDEGYFDEFEFTI